MNVSEATRRVVREAGRFLAVGGVATAVSFVLFNLSVHGLGDGGPLLERPVLAFIGANTIGMVVSYHGARYWAFRERPTSHPDGGRTAFVVVNVVTMTLPIVCLVISRDVLGLDDPLSDNVAANGVGLALGVSARFWIFRTFVFRRPIHLDDLYAEELVGLSDEPDGLDEEPVSGPTGRATSGPGDAPDRAAPGG